MNTLYMYSLDVLQIKYLGFSSVYNFSFHVLFNYLQALGSPWHLA